MACSNHNATDGGDTSESTLVGEDIHPSSPEVMERCHIGADSESLIEDENGLKDMPRRVRASQQRQQTPQAPSLQHQQTIDASIGGGGCESDQTAETAAPSPSTVMEDAPPPVVVHRRPLTTSTTTAARAVTNSTGSLPSLPSSPSRGGELASSEEESLAELEDANEEVSVAELSVGGRSCSSVETMERNRMGQVPAVVLPVTTRASTLSPTKFINSNNNHQQQPLLPVMRPRNSLESTAAAVAASTDTPIAAPSASKQAPDLLKREAVTSQDIAMDMDMDRRASATDATPSTSGAAAPSASQATAQPQQQYQEQGGSGDVHRPMSLPMFPNPENCMFTSTHAANCPSEDRSSSLVNVLLQPLPDNFDSETQLPPLEPDYKTLIRLSLWSVIDGHGGGCVATYASEVLLPHVTASISRALGCAIVDRGVCTVNGQLRDANALDLDGLIKTSDRAHQFGNNSIRYRSPFERAESEENDGAVPTPQQLPMPPRRSPLATDEEDNIPSSDNNDSTSKVAGVPGSASPHPGNESGSSVNKSVKTAASGNHADALLGTHSPREVAAITQAITESFLAVDEGWINSIDPVATHQTSCQSNGRWNSGACALVVFTIQRLDWTDVSGNDGLGDRERMRGGPDEKSRCHDTSHNRDAARRRMLDSSSRAKSGSSVTSTVSSTSSLTTEEAVHASGPESEITETEGEDDDDKSRSRAEIRRRYSAEDSADSVSSIPKESLISAPGGCCCHCYRAHDASLYTAHVGDCRAVLFGSAPPRTIKVRDSFADHPDTADDESSHHSSDETECLSSSDHDADSSDDEDIMDVEKLSVVSSSSRKQMPTTTSTPATSASAATPSYMSYTRRPVRRSRRRAVDDSGPNAPFYALPPLEKETVHGGQSSSPMIELTIDDSERRDRRKQRTLNSAPTGFAAATTGLNNNFTYGASNGNADSDGEGKAPSDFSTSSQDRATRLVHLPPVTRPIDLTTDHSAYNPAEVTAVLRRSNNAPRAISAGVGGGIKRVAGSLAVTRALGDAYLKVPRLSFLPYKSHAPYITARPEVNCRLVSATSDKVLILATDGVWERASGDDALRWVRNFYSESIADADRRNKKMSNRGEAASASDLPTSVILSPNYYDIRLAPASANGSTLINNSNNSVTKGSQEVTEQEQERQDDQNQKMDTKSLENTGGGKRKKDSSIADPIPSSTKRRKRSGRRGNAMQCGWSRSSSVADVIVRRVLNKVRRARKISSLHALMSLPQGRARRSKHDDITASVVDLSAFVS